MPIELLTDKIILIAGGTNPTGTAVVRYFLERNATIMVPSRSLDELNHLQDSLSDITTGKLITQLADLPDYDNAFDIAEIIAEKYGRLDIGINIVSGLPANKQLTEANISDWENIVDNQLTPFFISARLVLHSMKIKNGGVYINVCDGSEFDQHSSGPLSRIASNIQIEMSKMFASETDSYNIKYYHLFVSGICQQTKAGQKGLAKRIGGFIMKLYTGQLKKAEGIFQLLT
jgi:NAD(P)-dependent dehydrogenase (short-subunit alcohol dehydrogenase family)